MNWWKAFLISTAVLFLNQACQKTNLDEVESMTKERVIPNETAKDVQFIFSDSGHVKAQIISPRLEMVRGEDAYTEMPDGLQATFFDLHGRANAFLTAKYGKRFTNKKLIELKDSVVVVNIKNDTLNTQELYWDERKDIVYSKKAVRVKTTEDIIYSIGFESDPNFSYYKFYKITGNISLEE
jgi:LPS export ABC transporter protein LptC